MNNIDVILERLKGQQPTIDAPEELTERIMSSLPDLESDKPQYKVRMVCLWRWMAAAACLIIIIGIGTMLMHKDRVTQHGAMVAKVKSDKTVKDTQDTANPTEKTVELSSVKDQEDLQCIHPVVENMKSPSTKVKKHKEKEIPDTLGNSIWQSEQNVMLAMQMLSECEAIIEKSEQDVRNNIVKATFNAVPQPANVILVTNEAGDYYVSDTNKQTIIEL